MLVIMSEHIYLSTSQYLLRTFNENSLRVNYYKKLISGINSSYCERSTWVRFWGWCHSENSVAWVRERTIPTERLPIVGMRQPRGQRDGSLRPYSLTINIHKALSIIHTDEFPIRWKTYSSLLVVKALCYKPEGRCFDTDEVIFTSKFT
jgi:hypothetical protein